MINQTNQPTNQPTNQLKPLIALFLIAAMLLSLCVAVGAEEAQDEILYFQNFESFTELTIPADETYAYHYGYPSLSILSNIYAKTFLVNDANSVDGQYFMFDTYPPHTSYFCIGATTMTQDFNFDYCFGSMAKQPDETDSAMPTYNLLFYDVAGSSSTYNSGAGKLITFMTATDTITVVNDDATEDRPYNFTQGKWYDVRVRGHVPASGTPTYDLLIKEHGAANYTPVATGLSFPTSGDWTSGVGCNGVMTIESAWSHPTVAVDNVKLYYPARTITLQCGSYGSMALADPAQTSVAAGTPVTVNLTPDPGYVVGGVSVNGVPKTVTNNQVTFNVAEDSTVSAFFVRPNTIYFQNYDNWKVESGEFNHYNANESNSGWALNIGGSYNHIYLINDSLKKNGNYCFNSTTATEPAYSLTNSGNPGFEGGALKFVSDTDIEFSWMHRYYQPGSTTNLANGTNMNLCLYPVALYPNGERNGAGVIANINSHTGTVSTPLSNQTGSFTSVHDTWYDVKVKLVNVTTAPAFNLYIKKSSEDDYQLMLENVALPPDNYESGLGTLGMLQISNGYTTCALDDIQIYSNATSDIVTNVGNNGHISVNNVTDDPYFEVANGSTVTVTTIPDTGYEVDTVTCGGQTVQKVAKNSYQFVATENAELRVTFKEQLPKAWADGEAFETQLSKYNENDQKWHRATESTFTNYAMRFRFFLEVPSGKTVQTFGAYLVPFDLFGQSDQSGTTKAVQTLYSEPKHKADGDTFSADLLGIPRTQEALNRIMYVIPFVNSVPNIEGAFKKTVAQGLASSAQ